MLRQLDLLPQQQLHRRDQPAIGRRKEVTSALRASSSTIACSVGVIG